MLYIDGQPFNEFLSELRADINYLKELRMAHEWKCPKCGVPLKFREYAGANIGACRKCGYYASERYLENQKELHMDKEVDIKKEMEAQLGQLFLESRKIQARLQAIGEEILRLEKELQ